MAVGPPEIKPYGILKIPFVAIQLAPSVKKSQYVVMVARWHNKKADPWFIEEKAWGQQDDMGTGRGGEEVRGRRTAIKFWRLEERFADCYPVGIFSCVKKSWKVLEEKYTTLVSGPKDISSPSLRGYVLLGVTSSPFKRVPFLDPTSTREQFPLFSGKKWELFPGGCRVQERDSLERGRSNP